MKTDEGDEKKKKMNLKMFLRIGSKTKQSPTKTQQ
jgi:hypothetical protein